MGKPVKILDLAKQWLKGLKVKMKNRMRYRNCFTGLRPGKIIWGTTYYSNEETQFLIYKKKKW